MPPLFPQINDAKRQEMLALPEGHVRVVIDTDTDNEIDDQFALAWALLSQDVFQIEGVYAVPYSFQYRVDELLRAASIQEQIEIASDADLRLLSQYSGQLQRLQALETPLDSLTQNTPAEGMESSYQEILTVFDLLDLSPSGKVFRGSAQYLSSLDNPVRSPAAEHLIERALASSDQPLYVIAIGCLTNVASALLIEPEIINNIVVVWTAGYPSTVAQPNYSFNLEQDLLASQLLFESGVPLVYLPGYHIGAQLRLSLPEMEAWVRGKGKIGDYLYSLYTNNPLHRLLGIGDHYGRTWVIWDLINFAWLMKPAWVPTDFVPTPRLGDNQRWHQNGSNRPLMREAYAIDRDEIFRDFFRKLETAP